MTIEYSYIENDEYRKYFDSSGTLQSLDITKYNDIKKPSRITYFVRPDQEPINVVASDGFEEFFEMMKAYNFDVNGKETKISLSMDFLIKDHLYEYDQSGNEVLHEEYGYYEDSSVNTLGFVSGDYNVYDQNNLLIENDYHEIKTDWDDKFHMAIEYVLNEKGLVVEKITHTSANKIIENFNYNLEGKLISYIENRNDSEDVTEVFYDNYDNKIFEIRKSNYDGEYEEEITKYEIEYY